MLLGRLSAYCYGTVGMWDMRTGALVRMLRPDRLYERMDIASLRGITEAQRAALQALGAVERRNPPTSL
jgi:hypothetical protein